MGGNELLDHLITLFVKISSRLIFKIKSKKKKRNLKIWRRISLFAARQGGFSKHKAVEEIVQT